MLFCLRTGGFSGCITCISPWPHCGGEEVCDKCHCTAVSWGHQEGHGSIFFFTSFSPNRRQGMMWLRSSAGFNLSQRAKPLKSPQNRRICYPNQLFLFLFSVFISHKAEIDDYAAKCFLAYSKAVREHGN